MAAACQANLIHMAKVVRLHLHALRHVAGRTYACSMPHKILNCDALHEHIAQAFMLSVCKRLLCLWDVRSRMQDCSVSSSSRCCGAP